METESLGWAHMMHMIYNLGCNQLVTSLGLRPRSACVKRGQSLACAEGPESGFKSYLNSVQD